MNPLFMLDTALKAAQWERAKGELRALAAMQGSYQSRRSPDGEEPRWLTIERRIEEFIKEFEDEGLHE